MHIEKQKRHVIKRQKQTNIAFTFLYLNLPFEFGPDIFYGCRGILCDHSHFFQNFLTFKIDFFKMGIWQHLKGWQPYKFSRGSVHDDFPLDNPFHNVHVARDQVRMPSSQQQYEGNGSRLTEAKCPHQYCNRSRRISRWSHSKIVLPRRSSLHSGIY